MEENWKQSDYKHCVELFTWPAGCAAAPFTTDLKAEETKILPADDRGDPILTGNYPVSYSNDASVFRPQGGTSCSTQSAHILLLEGTNSQCTPKDCEDSCSPKFQTLKFDAPHGVPNVEELDASQSSVVRDSSSTTRGQSEYGEGNKAKETYCASTNSKLGSKPLRRVRAPLRLSRIPSGEKNIEKLDSCDLMHTPIPLWLERLQQRLPWYKSDFGEVLRVSLRTWDARPQWFWKELRKRWEDKRERWLLCLRGIVIFTTILFLLLMNVAKLGNLTHNDDVPSPWDWFHQITTPINEYITKNEAVYSVFMFLGGLLMDVLVLWVYIQWVVVGDSLRLPLAYVGGFMLPQPVKLAIQIGLNDVMCFILPFPKGYLWKAPKLGGIEWPSLVVPVSPQYRHNTVFNLSESVALFLLSRQYFTSDDFYFSGHVGCAILAALEHRSNHNWLGVRYSICVAVYETLWMCCTRGHYMVDVFGGAVVASWSYMVVQMIVKPIDRYLALPLRPHSHVDLVVKGSLNLDMEVSVPVDCAAAAESSFRKNALAGKSRTSSQTAATKAEAKPYSLLGSKDHKSSNRWNDFIKKIRSKLERPSKRLPNPDTCEQSPGRIIDLDYVNFRRPHAEAESFEKLPRQNVFSNISCG